MWPIRTLRMHTLKHSFIGRRSRAYVRDWWSNHWLWSVRLFLRLSFCSLISEFHSGVTAGQIDVATDLEAAIKAGLPTADASGSISMDWRQVNAGADGGGPGKHSSRTSTMKCLKLRATHRNRAHRCYRHGQQLQASNYLEELWVRIESRKSGSTTDGQGWSNRDGGADSDNPMTIVVPPGTTCTGGSTGDACLIRVINPPGFGSCFAIARTFESFPLITHHSLGVIALLGNLYSLRLIGRCCV